MYEEENENSEYLEKTSVFLACYICNNSMFFTCGGHNSIEKVQRKNCHKDKSRTDMFFLSKLVKLVKLISMVCFYREHLNVVCLRRVKTYSKRFARQVPESTLQNMSVATKHVEHGRTKHYTNIDKNKTLDGNEL